VLDKYPTWGILIMRTYSISRAAKLLEVDRKTLRRWVREERIPTPKPGIVDGRLSKCWTEDDIAEIKKHKAAAYWGRGIDRKTGKKARPKNK